MELCIYISIPLVPRNRQTQLKFSHCSQYFLLQEIFSRQAFRRLNYVQNKHCKHNITLLRPFLLKLQIELTDQKHGLIYHQCNQKYIQRRSRAKTSAFLAVAAFQLLCTCSKSAMLTPGQCVKKVNTGWDAAIKSAWMNGRN